MPATTYTVNSLLDASVGVGNAGTLRYVMNLANTNNTGTAASPDLIQFSVAGAINVGSTTGSRLPTLTDIAVIDGTTAPGYAGTPVVVLDGATAGADANGLTITGGSSTVKGLSIINFLGDGIELASKGNNTVAGNYIGTNAAGAADLGNGGDGVRIVSSNGNLIGHNDPFTKPSYFNANQVSPTVSGWTGIRNSDTAGNYLISGLSSSNGLLFDGTIAGAGSAVIVNYPSTPTVTVTGTTVYGPDNLDGNLIRLVGTYTTSGSSNVNGFLFEGTTADVTNPARFRTVNFPAAQFTFVHSTMGGLAVGNYDSAAAHGQGGLPLGPGHAFIYDIATNTFLTDIVFPGSVSDTAYGIWHNGENRYTICGGWSPNPVNNFDNQDRPIGKGYLVDYNSRTGEFNNWKSFDYPFAANFVTHFEGISSVEKGVYTLAADSVQAGSANPTQGSWVSVRRNTEGTFGEPVWVNLNFPGVDPTTNLTSSNSVFGNQVVGIVLGPSPFPFQATINTAFQLSNVISGNAGNGIGVFGSNDNVIAMNYIGTNAAGTADLGNGGSGIFVTAGAARNLIGGEATGGNNPTGGVFVRPPQGNLISGNAAWGVFITGQATLNQLSGNFIGTTASGNAPLGNELGGVTIENADFNRIIGCTFQQNPFVFYNVISGNGLNGLRVIDADNTTVHASFFGLGADNITPVGNDHNGVIVNGSSANIQFGGKIPLGNVVAGNGRNGVEIADTASGGVYFNTFSGLPAFIVTAVPNVLDGFLITSTGGNNVLETNVISGNGANGIHLAGNVTGVKIEDAIVGLATEGNAPLPNGANGVLIDGNAHDNLIGGQQVSVIMQNAISANGMDGIAIVGNAFNNVVNQSYIGTNILGDIAFGNAGQGIFVGGNAKNNIIGSDNPVNQNVISGNLGQGIQLGGNSTGTQILGNLIGTDRTGTMNLANRDVGILIGSSGNVVGVSGAGNVIAFSQIGVIVYDGTGNAILGNSIYSNVVEGIDLAFGGNNEQPAPVLTNAVLTLFGVEISGTLTAAANTAYTVQVFASPTQAPGQGKTFLGSVLTTTNASGTASFVFESPLPSGAGLSFTATATDPLNNSSAFSAPFSAGIFVASPDAGGGPQINVYNDTTGQLTLSFFAYDPTFTGGVRVAVADVNGDGVQEIITGPGPGGGPNIRVFDSRTGTIIPGPLGNFMAYNASFTAGVFVAAGDLNGDGFADIIVGPDAGGGPNVIAFSGADGAVLHNFMAYDPAFTGGVRVAAGDTNGDGKADIICGPGAGGGPNVTVFGGVTGALLQSFFAFNPAFTAGIYVAAGDTNGDGKADIIAGAGAGGGPQVNVFSGRNAALLQSFFALPEAFFGGVRVGSFISATTGRANILTGAGPGGGPQVTAFDGVSLAVLDNFFAFSPGFTGGVFVGGA